MSQVTTGIATIAFGARFSMPGADETVVVARSRAYIVTPRFLY
jgi:hypothetical protein